jgi:hypothetical protein
MLVVCMGIEALWQFQLHTICKKNGVHREISKYTPCIKYTTHRILNIWIKHGILNVLIEFWFGTARWVHYYSIQVSVPPDSYNLFVILTHEYKNIWDDMNQISGMISSCMFWASRLEPWRKYSYHKANTIWNGNSWKWGLNLKMQYWIQVGNIL